MTETVARRRRYQDPGTRLSGALCQQNRHRDPGSRSCVLPPQVHASKPRVILSAPFRLPPNCYSSVPPVMRVDDFVHGSADRGTASFGLHRLSIRQLASSLAGLELARRGMAIASPLGAEAVAARAAFEALADNSLDYLAPVARLRSIGQTLGTTIGDLRDADIDVGLLDAHGAAGRDLRVLAERYEEQLSQAALVDHAALFQIAAEAVPRTAALPVSGPLLLLDVGVRDDATAGLVRALCAQASEVLATVPHGDDWTMRMLSGLPDAGVQPVTDEEESDAGALSRVRRFLFSTDSPPELTEPTVDSATGHDVLGAWRGPRVRRDGTCRDARGQARGAVRPHGCSRPRPPALCGAS